MVSSPEQKVNTAAKTLLNIGDFIVRADSVWSPSARWNGYTRDQFSDWKFKTSNSTIQAGSLALNSSSVFVIYKVDNFSVTLQPILKKEWHPPTYHKHGIHFTIGNIIVKLDGNYTDMPTIYWFLSVQV